METVSQVAGRPLVLACDVSGIPAPTVTWLKDRMPVGEYARPACHLSAKHLHSTQQQRKARKLPVINALVTNQVTVVAHACSPGTGEAEPEGAMVTLLLL